jgi:hypothetical protein
MTFSRIVLQGRVFAAGLLYSNKYNPLPENLGMLKEGIHISYGADEPE